jgi:hypothetical protein
LEAELSSLREPCGVRHRAAQADTTRSDEWAFGRDPQARTTRMAPQTKRGSPGWVNPGDPRLLAQLESARA